ncbi:hypothetical protein MAR_000070 [Mya arenaria]|uniref:Uncharacterized protein n=1 Tax=Mya arenaria TaxID=6604 RepID=A0ABY7F7Q9_MYAAR|nr:hypothetical protein MAR_000070 [Mya arenaria]
MLKRWKVAGNCAILMFLVMTVLVYMFCLNKGLINYGFKYNQLNTTLTLINNDVAEPSAKSDTPTVAQNITKAEYSSTQCKHRQVKLSERRLPLTGLLSFPGSGNTWTRHLIQQMTGTVNIPVEKGFAAEKRLMTLSKTIG